MFVARWRPDHPRTHVAEKGFVLGRILNSPFVILTLPLVWLPLQSDMGLLGQVCLLGWATGPINSALITSVTDQPSHYILEAMIVSSQVTICSIQQVATSSSCQVALLSLKIG